MTSPEINVSPGTDATLTLEVNVSRGSAVGFVEELGRFVAGSSYLQGAVLTSTANENGSAFAGGDKGGYVEDMATILASWNTPEAIRDATLLTVSEERLAEISDTYSLPDYLRTPDNEVDAAVSYVVKRLIGYSDDNSISLQDEADQSTASVVATPGLTVAQRKALTLMGSINKMRGVGNALHRARQIETFDHVLRFFIIREMRRPHSDGKVFMSVDYEWATGALGDAINVVNGSSNFLPDGSDENDPRLSRGMLGQKSNIIIQDGVVTIGSQNTSDRAPIWPQAAVEQYQAEQAKLQAELAEERSIRAAEQLQLEADRALARQEQKAAEQQEWRAEIDEVMQRAEDEEFQWLGIYVLSGLLGDPGKLEEYVRKQHPGKEIMIVPGTAIYAGKTPVQSAKEATVYIK